MKLRMIAIVLMLPIVINLLVFSSTDIVVEAQEIRVTGVHFSTNEIVFDRLNTTQYAVATVLPIQATNRRVNFESKAPEIASVDATGAVTAHANGMTTITVRTVCGDFHATLNVRVESFYIETFEIELEDDNNILFPGDSAKVTVRLSPIEGMGNDNGLPMISVNTRDIIDIPAFEELASQDGYSYFTTTITAIRPGFATVIVSIVEAQTGISVQRRLYMEVWAADGELGFLFNGSIYCEENSLTTITSRIPLRVNRQADEMNFSLKYDTSIAVIENLDDEYYLVFKKAGEVIVEFEDEIAGHGSVLIESTFGQLNLELLSEELEQFSNLSVFLRRTTQINFNVTPSDFEIYYDVVWNSSPHVAHQVTFPNDITITPTLNALNQWVEVTFINRETEEETLTHRMNVGINSFGACEIIFALNIDANSQRGLEQTLVFGNQRSDGENFVHRVIFFATGLPGFTQMLEFTSSNENLARVDNLGVITFMNDYTGFDINNRAFVKITARSLYENMAGEIAMAYFIFEVVRAANVHDFFEYQEANNNNRDIVLQNTISFFNPFTTNVSLFGNGFHLDASQLANSLNDVTTQIFTFFNNENFISNNTTIISNVVFSGFADESQDLSIFATRGTLVTINSNTVMQYSVLQRASVLLNIRVDVYTSNGLQPNRNITVQRNLLRSAGFAGAFLGDSYDHGRSVENIVFEDLIFENTLIGILFHPGLIGLFEDEIMQIPIEMQGAQSPGDLGTFELTIKGEMKFYNWIIESVFDNLWIDFFGLPLGFSRLNLRNFGFDTYEDENGIRSVLLSIVELNGIITSTQNISNDMISRGAFENETNVMLADQFDSNEFIGNFSIMGIQVALYATVLNPDRNSSSFISPADQLSHFQDPDRSLITRPLA